MTSSYNANIVVNVQNQRSVDRLAVTIGRVSSLVKQIKPINLLAPGTGAGADTIKVAMTEIGKKAKAIQSDVTKLSATFAGASSQASAFSDILANVKIEPLKKGKSLLESQKAEVRAIAEAFAMAEKKAGVLEDRFQGLLNSARQAQGLAIGPATELGSLEAELQKRTYYEKQITKQKREQDRLNKKAKKDERDRARAAEKTARERKRALGDFAASVGFPLLFGGGPGAVAGGAAGSILGSLAGAGFGGQILGSALGQQLDKLGSAALRTGETFNRLTKNIEEFIPKLGTSAQPGFAGTAEFLVSQGRGSEVATVARNAFEQAYGPAALKRFEELGQTSKEFGQVMEELGVTLQDFMSGPLRGLLEAIKKVTGTGGQTPAEKARSRFESDVAGLAPRIEQLQGQNRLSINEQQELNTLLAQREGLYAVIAQYTREINGETSKNLTLNKILQDVLRQQESIQRQETDLVRTRLAARRDSFAAAEGQLAVEKAQNALLNTQKQLTEEEGRENQDTLLILQLQNQVKTKQGILDRARLDAANKITLAERQIMTEQIAGAANQIKAIRQEQRLELQLQQGRQGRFTLVEKEAKQLKDEFVSNGLILDLERKRALIGVTEAERISSINRDYDLRVRLLEKEFELNKLNLQQAEAANKLSRQRVAQSLEMERAQAGVSAAQQIRATSPFAQETALLDPFFGTSNQLQAEQALRYQENLSLLNQELDNVLKNQKIFALSPEVLQGLQDQENALKNQIAVYREYQPAIDEAALAQARFNEALAITTPVTNNLLDSITSVVAGTKTAEQAFADFLRSIASMLADAAKQMIATYIAIGIARMFAGVPKMSGGEAIDITAVNEGTVNSLGGLNFGGYRANGGKTTPGNAYMVGERGPELFVPRTSGAIVPNHAMGSANVTVNVDASGSSVEGSADEAAQLGKAIGVAVQQELIKQKRPGGLLAS